MNPDTTAESGGCETGLWGTLLWLEAAVSKNAAPARGPSLARARRGQRLAMWLGAVGLCSVPLIGWAAVSLTEFQAGTPIVAADVNENFAALAAAVNAGQRIEISQLETFFQCATSSLCLSKNLEVTLETADLDGARAPVYAVGVTSEAEELFRAAAALPEVERAALIVRLLDSIAAQSDVVASQADESRRRLAAAQVGDVEILDDDDAWRLISG